MSSLHNIQQLLSGMGMQEDTDANLADTSEQVCISSLALLKMLKHGRAGVPMEVMGLMLGEFVDDYTIRVVDVFSMPQSGNSVSVEAVDPAYQTAMLDMLKITGRGELVVGWYHSHPGFGCWFSATDVSTQQAFERLNSRAVGVVVDPIQSVKGKVVMDCFRLINTSVLVQLQDPRQTTSNIGHLNKPTITALVHGLNRHYYSLCISCKKSQLEERMLSHLHQKTWCQALQSTDYSDCEQQTIKSVRTIKDLCSKYAKSIEEEIQKTPGELIVSKAGKIDAKKRLESEVETLMGSNLLQVIGGMIGLQGVPKDV
eukprot:GHVU01084378.1.p1 GENE.GHVU01084378.1~~GHVU01084378.1.p1  ORF type:complete len:337 (+),score=44.35 GHVU01084378.1:72-1013(+)